MYKTLWGVFRIDGKYEDLRYLSFDYEMVKQYVINQLHPDDYRIEQLPLEKELA